jgi:hypothetical protein
MWLSLAVVLTCALGSFGSPARATSGSAFNAFTSDVSLGPSRASEPEKERREQRPAAGSAGQAKMVPAAARLPAPPPIIAARYFVLTSDPPAPATAGALGARAPPLR